MINAVIILAALFRVHFHGRGNALVAFPDEVIVVKTVVFAVHQYPKINAISLRLIVVINHDIGDAGVIGQVPLILAESHDNLCRRITVLEDKVRDL